MELRRLQQQPDPKQHPPKLLSQLYGCHYKALGKGLRTGLRQEGYWLLSPMAPLGLAAVPVTLAWGAAAAPFCMLGDLVSKLTPERDIKVLADSAPASPIGQGAPDAGNGRPTKSNP